MHKHITKKEMLKKIKEKLAQFDFVQWDRYVDIWQKEKMFVFYGWIERKQDCYKDFLVFEFWQSNNGEPIFITSSAEWESKIEELLEIPSDPNDDCKRIENLFDLPNIIRLS